MKAEFAVPGPTLLTRMAAAVVLAVAIALCLGFALASVRDPAGGPGLRETVPSVGR